MISTGYRFIFLHIPKTGGNSVQKALLPFSDDHIVVGPFRDGIDRFDIQGPVTCNKHMALEGYADALGERLEMFRKVVTVRDPLDRAVSMYFSPHRILRGHADLGSFDFENFSSMLAAMRPAVSYLEAKQRVREPDVVLRFSHLEKDFGKFVEEQGIPASRLSTLNSSAASANLRSAVRSDRRVVGLVRRTFARDYEFFGEVLASQE